VNNRLIVNCNEVNHGKTGKAARKFKATTSSSTHPGLEASGLMCPSVLWQRWRL